MEEKAKRGRPAKSEIKQNERRRRKGATGAIPSKMPVPEELLKDNNFVYRFFNDVGNRITHMTTNDDWDMVDSSGGNVGVDKGKALSHYVGTKEDGSPLTAYLMKKPRQYYEEDKASEQVGIDEKMNDIRKGAQGVTDAKLAGKVYNTDEGIKL